MVAEIQGHGGMVWVLPHQVSTVAKVGHVTHHELGSGLGCLESSDLIRWRGRSFG
jgi:hypothetical protein